MLRKLTYIGLVAVAVGSVVGVGYAAIPSSNGTISSCKQQDGSIKLIDKEAGASLPIEPTAGRVEPAGPARAGRPAGSRWAGGAGWDFRPAIGQLGITINGGVFQAQGFDVESVSHLAQGPY